MTLKYMCTHARAYTSYLNGIEMTFVSRELISISVW